MRVCAYVTGSCCKLPEGHREEVLSRRFLHEVVTVDGFAAVDLWHMSISMVTAMRSVPDSLPLLDEAADPRIVLRDGSVAGVRPATPADVPAMQRFFHDLSPESRYLRFCSAAEPPESLVTRLCESADPARGMTVVAERVRAGELRIVAAASYQAINPRE